MPQLPTQFEEDYTPDQLIAGTTQLVTRTYTFAAGQTLTRGTMVGINSSTGKATISTQAATDGTQIPIGILADDVNAAAYDAVGPVYLKGEFNENQIVFGTGWNATNAFGALRDMGIWLKPTVAASGRYL